MAGRLHGERGVLRARPVPAGGAARARLLDDVAWLHAFQAGLARQGFPAPRPLPAFAGRSWTAAGGRVWALVTFIPGREVGWNNEPGLGQIGALLARHHAAARRVKVDRQRPGVIPLADVPAILLSPRLAAACPDPGRAAVIRHVLPPRSSTEEFGVAARVCGCQAPAPACGSAATCLIRLAYLILMGVTVLRALVTT